MDIARFGVSVLVEVYGAIAPPYGDQLHCHFASLQSKGQAKEQKADMLSFGVQSAEDMLLLVNELSQRATFQSFLIMKCSSVVQYHEGKHL
jgi:phage terminase large subunit-like protein